jgi:hypothetical protein
MLERGLCVESYVIHCGMWKGKVWICHEGSFQTGAGAWRDSVVIRLRAERS